MEHSLFAGLDVHKKSTSVAIAESGRGGEVRFHGEVPSTPEALRRLVEKLGRPDRRLHFCYVEREQRSMALAATASIGCCEALIRTVSWSRLR